MFHLKMNFERFKFFIHGIKLFRVQTWTWKKMEKADFVVCQGNSGKSGNKVES